MNIIFCGFVVILLHVCYNVKLCPQELNFDSSSIYIEDSIEAEEYDETINEYIETPLPIYIGGLLGLHIPDAEFDNGWGASIFIKQSMNTFCSFLFNVGYNKYGFNYNSQNNSNRKVQEISLNWGIILYVLLKNSGPYIGIDIGTFSEFNTFFSKNPTFTENSNSGNKLLFCWNIGYSQQILSTLFIETVIKLKSNHTRNITINAGVSYIINSIK